MSELLTIQKAFTEHLRDPDHVPVPRGLDARRMGIYSELIFNNVSALLSDFFPVIRTLLSDGQWDKMVRDFFIAHQSQTPYFMELSGEFAQYLAQSQLTNDLPDFLAELAHYEWIELALYTLDDELPETALEDIGTSALSLSTLAAPLAYQYPVHRISRDFQPTSPAEDPAYLLVIRDTEEKVRFFELQPFSFQLLHQIQQNPGLIPEDWLGQTAIEIGIEDRDAFIDNGIDLLKSFNTHRIFIAG
jgi:hypothetical protein